MQLALVIWASSYVSGAAACFDAMASGRGAHMIAGWASISVR